MADDPRAICAECGHVRSWHDREAARGMRGGELASDRRCYREVGGAVCRCTGYRDSGEFAVAGVAPQSGGSVARLAMLTLLLIVMGLGLLYAYRSQSPDFAPISYSEAVRAINAGQVRTVTIMGNSATLELQTGEKQVAGLPDRPEAFQKVLDDHNSANPSRPIPYQYQPENAALSTIASILLSLLPIGTLAIYVFRRSSSR